MNIDYKTMLQASIKGKIVETKQGASGIVYIVDNGENTYPRKIAYKSIRVDKLNNETEKYFIEECNRWFKLSNNYLVKPFYSKIIDNLPFICMPYYKLDLKSLMLQKDFTEIEALVISIQLCKALYEMQKEGIKYHQDFNPPNILLQDLSKSFPNYPTFHCINYFPKIADFGIANLIKRIGPTLGGGGGKFPFKAPEQYDTKKYDSYNPDIFALGVITYMLLTNKHPNGLNKRKALNKNTSASEFKEWAFKAKINLSNKKLENIINQSLLAEPSQRPSVKKIYIILSNELKKLNYNIYANLKLRLDYFDTLNQFDTLSKDIDILSNLSKLPNNKEIIYNQVIGIISEIIDNIKHEKDLIKLCEYYKFTISLSKNINNIDILKKYSTMLIELLYKWYPRIKVYHKYPQQKFQDKIIVDTPNFRDIEIISEYIIVIYNFLNKYMSDDSIVKLFKQYKNDIFYSIFLYSKASLIRLSNIHKCISLLNNAKKLNVKEPLFDYMKYLWIKNIIMIKKDTHLEEIANETYQILKNNYNDWETISNL